MDVQGRFEQVHDSPYGEVKASMLTAIAAKDNVSATVEVKIIHLFGIMHPSTYLVGCVIQKRKILFYLVLHENASLFFSNQAWKSGRFLNRYIAR